MSAGLHTRQFAAALYRGNASIMSLMIQPGAEYPLHHHFLRAPIPMTNGSV